ESPVAANASPTVPAETIGAGGASRGAEDDEDSGGRSGSNGQRIPFRSSGSPPDAGGFAGPLRGAARPGSSARILIILGAP
ncbi:MAG: hypothetical protein AAFZ18_39360, partial [Myxococcota bacterium]